MSPLRFLREVRQEVSKVTWPTRGEVITTSIMVFIMALFFSLLFFFAGQLFAYLIELILGI